MEVVSPARAMRSDGGELASVAGDIGQWWGRRVPPRRGSIKEPINEPIARNVFSTVLMGICPG